MNVVPVCVWKECVEDSDCRYKDVTLTETGEFIGDVYLCRPHLTQARITGHMDLKKNFLRRRKRYAKPPPGFQVPPVVLYAPPPPTIEAPKPAPAPAKKKRGSLARRAFGKLVVRPPAPEPVPHNKRPRKPKPSDVSVAGDGSGISGAYAGGREILPRRVPWMEDE